MTRVKDHPQFAQDGGPVQAPGVETPAQIRARLMREAIAAARARIMATPVSAAASAPAVPAMQPPQPVGSHLARAERRRVTVCNPKLHQVDVRHVPAGDGSAFMSRVRQVTADRLAGDPMATTIMQVAQALAWAWRKNASGAVQITHRELAAAARVKSPETVRRVIRWLEAADLVDTVNVMTRAVVDGVRRLVRAANLYLMPAAAPGGPAPAPKAPRPPTAEAAPGVPASAVQRAPSVVARWSRVFGQALSALAWNRVPLQT